MNATLRTTTYAAVLTLVIVLLIAAPDVAWATHRATEPCVDCSWFNFLCRFGNFLANCHGGH